MGSNNRYDDEFKASSIKMVVEKGRAIRAVAKDLGEDDYLDLMDSQLRVYIITGGAKIMGEARRTYSKEFKEEAVELLKTRGKYIRHLGNTPGHINHWSKASFIKNN